MPSGNAQIRCLPNDVDSQQKHKSNLMIGDEKTRIPALSG